MRKKNEKHLNTKRFPIFPMDVTKKLKNTHLQYSSLFFKRSKKNINSKSPEHKVPPTFQIIGTKKEKTKTQLNTKILKIF